MEKELPVAAVSKVLFVKVSVVALPTSVSVAAGSVSVPEAAAVASSVVLPLVVPATFSRPTAPADPNVFAPVTVSALPRVMAVPEAAGPVSVTPSGRVSVAAVAGAVMATLLMLLAVATPSDGVTRFGEVAKTAAPVPVSSVSAAARFALDGVPSQVAMPVPKPLTPVEIGSPVALVSVPELGVPSAGVTRTGEVAKTAAPDPVSSVSAAARFALDGVAAQVATPVPRPLTPVEIGSPVALVSVPELGVPSAGVTRTGEVAKTAAPVPVSSVSAARRFALDGVTRKFCTPLAQAAMVPTCVIFACTAAGSVCTKAGTLDPSLAMIAFAEDVAQPSGLAPAPNGTQFAVNVARPLPPLETESGEVPGFVCASADKESARQSAGAVAKVRSSRMVFFRGLGEKEASSSQSRPCTAAA
jgi:hypothetical protein